MLQRQAPGGGCACHSAIRRVPGPSSPARGRRRRIPPPPPSGARNGRPHTAHHGGRRSDRVQHVAHSASGSSTVAPHARQRGGSTPSTTARPTRCTGDAKMRGQGCREPHRLPLSGCSCHHPGERAHVNPACAAGDPFAPSWHPRIRPQPRCSTAAPGAPIATARRVRARSISCMTRSAIGCSIGSTWSTGIFPTRSISGRGTARSRGRLAQRPGTTRVVAGRAGGPVSRPGERRARRGRSRAGAVSRRQLRSRRQQSGAALGGRSARRAGAAAPRAEAGRAAARGDARRADADRTAHRAVRGRAGRGGRGQPARVAVDRARRRRRAVAARRLCAAGRRQRDDHGRPIPIRWR